MSAADEVAEPTALQPAHGLWCQGPGSLQDPLRTVPYSDRAERDAPDEAKQPEVITRTVLHPSCHPSCEGAPGLLSLWYPSPKDPELELMSALMLHFGEVATICMKAGAGPSVFR